MIDIWLYRTQGIGFLTNFVYRVSSESFIFIYMYTYKAHTYQMVLKSIPQPKFFLFLNVSKLYFVYTSCLSVCLLICLSVCLFVCLFVPNKRQNGWTDRAHDPREGLWNIKIEEEKMDFILKMRLIYVFIWSLYWSCIIIHFT